MEPDLEEYVKSEEFDQECALQLRKALGPTPVSDKDSSWSDLNKGTYSCLLSGEPSPHEVSRVEDHLYYASLSPNGCGPKQIYRISNDKFIEPEGPSAYKHLMRLCPVPEDHLLGQDGLWDCILDQVSAGSQCSILPPDVHSQVVELLDKEGIKLTSIDLVQFTWLEKEDDQEIQEEEDSQDNNEEDTQNYNLTYEDIPTSKPVRDGKRHTTNLPSG